MHYRDRIGNHSYLHLLTILILTICIITSCKSSGTTFNGETDQREIEIPLAQPDADQQKLSDEKKEYSATVDIDSLIQSMTLREKIGQLFVIPVNGTFINEQDQRYLEWKRLIERYYVGGLIFMSGDIYGQAMLTNKFQKISKYPLWISQDMEFGAAMRVSGTTRFTPAMGVAATGNPDNAFLKGQITAREAKALGVHQIYAPVLDVNNNPENPVINVRSFSADPETVSTFGQAFIAGVESEGLLATAKHFPGHGDTDTDSHLALPVINHSYDRLETVELHPFRYAINNGLRSIMSAHIAFPNISSNPETPGTLDPDILGRILADSLGFNGLIVTDGLEMSGITTKYSPGDAVVRSLQAGADVMLISPDEMTAMYEVEKAVERGIISEERIVQSLRKILQLKKEQGLFDTVEVDIESIGREINTPLYRKVAGRIARESVTLLKNDRNILPISDAKFQRIVVVSVADDRSGSTGTSLASELRRYHSNVTFHVVDQRTGEDEKVKILDDAASADLLIIGSFIFVRSHQPMQLTDEQHAFLHQLQNLDKPSVLIAFGNPYVLNDLENTDVHLLAWSASSHQVRNTVPALFSGQRISGKLPAPIPGLYATGEGIDIPHSGMRFDIPESVGLRTDSLMILDEVMQTAIEDSIFPGGSIAVIKDGVLAWHKGYGYHDYAKTRPVYETDVFDLASITKVMATTTAIMKLYEEGQISLDDKVSDYIPDFDEPGKEFITIRHLLTHTSGLPAFQIYVDRYRTRSEILRAIRNEPLINTPGEEYVYSDLGFILLGDIVEIVSGIPLDRYIRRYFFYPMGMNAAHFNPSRLGNWMSRRIPPTEFDDIYERGVVQGVVHDERAYFMDGIAGHAGLFGSSRDLAIWAQMLLNKGYYNGRRYLDPKTVELFTSSQSPINERGLGFDRKSGDYSSAGSLTGKRIFGHLGFTGTSIWIDPDHNIAIILLTNRTYPHRRYGSEIRNIRPKIADTVMRSITD
jgi:beta-N-acetylhexosaminidase